MRGIAPLIMPIVVAVVIIYSLMLGYMFKDTLIKMFAVGAAVAAIGLVLGRGKMD